MYQDIGKGVYFLRIIGVKDERSYELTIRFSSLADANRLEYDLYLSMNGDFESFPREAYVWIPAGRTHGARIDVRTIVMMIVGKE